jgi:hypothetical protein
MGNMWDILAYFPLHNEQKSMIKTLLIYMPIEYNWIKESFITWQKSQQINWKNVSLFPHWILEIECWKTTYGAVSI